MNSDNPKIQILLTLDQPSNTRKWPDYLSKYGFNEQDVPALLALFADEEINVIPSDRPEIWAPLYAWRILGQLGSEQAIGPIVQSFDTLHEDDSALSELPGVIGMIGPAAIPVLAEYWRQPGKDEFSYVMAMDALCEIVKQHPSSREQIINIYIDYMGHPNKLAGTLNGLLMACLMDLNATEAIDGIRRLYALNCVDISCTGDLEDVEIELGFRSQRSTQRPSMAQIFGIQDPFESIITELGDDEDLDYDEDEIFQLIEYYLLRYGSDDSILGGSELDGFFAALVCSPETIMPSSWMPVIWGVDELSPEWESEQEFARFSQALLAHYNNVVTDFQLGDYEPLFMDSTDNDSELLIVDDWCEGFFRGLGLWGEMPPQDMKQLEHCMYPIRYFGTDERFDALQTMNHSEIQELQQSIRPRLEKLYRHFSRPQEFTNATFVRASPKAGRNDPCPCGSGKKYKKCCGLN
jgi:yecA family protein